MTKDRPVYTVSGLTQQIASVVSSQFATLRVEGELSNLSRPGSGHWYFSLKDSRSQIRCAMFRHRNRQVAFQPENGQQILIRGKLDIYQQRGDLQFIAEHMEIAGLGALQRQFEETRAKLQALGWFDDTHKKPLPAWPRTIGLVTSPTGAAIRDILNVVRRRAPGTHIYIYPTLVQGNQAAANIIRQIRIAEQRNEVDVLLLARGGGSLEDLWAFNDEALAKTVFECSLPIVTGVGHETDITIADYVADLRAPTPSAAAELTVPDYAAAGLALNKLSGRLGNAMNRQLTYRQQLARQLNTRLVNRHPRRRMQQQMQYLDSLTIRLHQQLRRRHLSAVQALGSLTTRLSRRHPARVIEQRHTQLGQLASRNFNAMEHRLQQQQIRLRERTHQLLRFSPQSRIPILHQRLEELRNRNLLFIRRLLGDKRHQVDSAARALNAVSPLATLSRGYAAISLKGKIVNDSAQLMAGDEIQARLARGSFRATVSAIADATADDPATREAHTDS